MFDDTDESRSHVLAEAEGDTADLARSLMLTDMPGPTRSAALRAIRAVRNAVALHGEITVPALRAALDAPTTELRAALGERATQTLSDARRGLRAWDCAPRRRLAIALRDRLPTLTDAVAAAQAALPEAEARRVRIALEALAQSERQKPEDMAASAVVIEPILRRLTPEALGVTSPKSLRNKLALIRAAVKRVDMAGGAGRIADISALSPAWRAALDAVEQRLLKSALSPIAILRRFAVSAAAAGCQPTNLAPDVVEDAWDRELAARGARYREKISAACRAWNGAVDAGLAAARRAPPRPTSHRQVDVPWSTVPEPIRGPIDAWLANTVSARTPIGWAALVPDAPAAYDGLGLDDLLAEEADADGAGARVVLEPGTAGNWRAAVARAWRVAMDDPLVQPKPERLADLFDRSVAAAMVAATREARRTRMERQGLSFDPEQKGRHEHSLVEALESVGRVLAVDETRLAQVRAIKLKIDPAIIRTHRNAAGETVRVHEERRIGKRHAAMLAAFSDLSVMGRYFGASDHLWSSAIEPIRRQGAITMRHAALARSALILRIGQFCGPIRRINHARLRAFGDDAHVHLPVGEGHGTLTIPATETKTFRRICVRIDPRTVAMLKVYIEHFLPVVRKAVGAAPDNPHLWPGAAGDAPEEGGYGPGLGYIDPGKLNARFSQHVWGHCKLRLCLHVMRHLAGKIILDQDPSAMSLVQHLLGHTSIRTTQSYYAEVNQIIAQQRYLHLLDRSMRQALRGMSFSIDDA
ncbi:MAG: hypothetical protein ACK4WC_00630 [Rubrimonas sp.]